MPVYFFDTIINGDICRDDEGVELPNIAVARQEALGTLYALAFEAGRYAVRVDAGMRVREETGALVARLDVHTVVDSVDLDQTSNFGGLSKCK